MDQQILQMKNVVFDDDYEQYEQKKIVFFHLMFSNFLKNLKKKFQSFENEVLSLQLLKLILKIFPSHSHHLKLKKNIVSYLDNIFAENQKFKNLYQAQIKNLDEMKQSFLKKAFAGELV